MKALPLRKVQFAFQAVFKYGTHHPPEQLLYASYILSRIFSTIAWPNRGNRHILDVRVLLARRCQNNEFSGLGNLHFPNNVHETSFPTFIGPLPYTA